jgi:geranylgeranyl diphosphate synthase type 3
MNNYLFPIEQMLLEPVQYYCNTTGKNIRKQICNMFGNTYKIPGEYIENVINLIDVFHNASLVIDDIEDNSKLRRNKEAAHIKYGTPLSLNAGYLSVFKLLDKFNKDPRFNETIKNKIIENIYLTHVGQGMDIYYTSKQIIPNLDEYYKMIEYKTGMLFLTMLDLVKEHVNKEKYNTLYSILLKFSYFYQIRDDYINVTDPVYWKERGFCQDVDEQKISFIITYIHNYKLKDYNKILKLLEKKNKIKLIRLFYKSGVFDHIYKILLNLKNEIIESVKKENLFDMIKIFEELPFNEFNIESINPFIEKK